MLADWLKPVPVKAFMRDYLRKEPYARPSSALSAVPLFGWATLDKLLKHHPTADILVVARGRLVDRPVPRNLVVARDLMAEGVGLVIRRPERHDAGVARLAAALREDIPGEARVQLFVTPADTFGLGWHYDDEDLFIVQTHGTKEYFFRDNTVERDRPRTKAPDFSRFSSETSPVGTVRLNAGDWLYLPSRWWHVAKCAEDSLSISIGVLPAKEWLAKVKGQGKGKIAERRDLRIQSPGRRFSRGA